jgi:glycosyltransferase involved in cell wall biosynthesis
MPLPIALIAYRRSSSGIATYTIELAKALSRVFEVVMPAFGLSPLTRKELEERGVRVVDFGRDPFELGYLGGPLIEYRLLSEKTRKCLSRLGEIDCLLFTIPGLAVKFRSQKLMVKGRGYHGLFHAITTRLRYLPYTLKIPGMVATIEYWLMDNDVFTRAKKIICPTQASYEFHKAKFGAKATYIPPPIEYSSVEKRPAERLRILFVSRDLSIPRKNLMTLLKALGMLSEGYLKKVKMTLVGRNPHRFRDWLHYLKMKGAEVDVIGYVDRERMADIYSNSDVLIYPSYYEELGYAVLEAMAHSLPVIASNISSFSDMIIDGYNGFLMKPNDHRRLARLLSMLIEDHKMCHDMGKRSLEVIKERFDPKLVAQKFKCLVNDI